MKFIIIVFFLMLTTTVRLWAQSPSIALIDDMLREMTLNDKFSGAVLIADKSHVLLSKGYGYADRENKVLNTPDTRFDLSSASKVFVGTVITRLAQQHKLKFTDTIGRYISGLPKGNFITIHQILTHSAGFNDFFNAKGFSYQGIKNCTDMLPFMRSMPLVYHPGDSCIYSTGDAIILGAVVEKITGMSFQDYFLSSVCEPLKLTNTVFTPYWMLNEQQRQYAIGYTKDVTGIKRRPFDYDHGSVPLSAGGAWSSVHDLYKFDQAVFGAKLINQKYLKLMTAEYTPQWGDSHFGYLWITTDKKDRSFIGHPGDSSGWHAMNARYIKQGYTVIILTNFGFADQYALLNKIENLLFSK
ncbi:serine hydrolase domain-containing protein [Mucilaginibacter sp. CSA2-8R]|uniref:serine hydrolase domain-containing protein n=1 Tax=Mucilaginibacter sp. CSA2-8R TaxID=3141542 RepID=UPI00315C7BFF